MKYAAPPPPSSPTSDHAQALLLFIYFEYCHPPTFTLPDDYGAAVEALRALSRLSVVDHTAVSRSFNQASRHITKWTQELVAECQTFLLLDEFGAAAACVEKLGSFHGALSASGGDRLEKLVSPEELLKQVQALGDLTARRREEKIRRDNVEQRAIQMSKDLDALKLQAVEAEAAQVEARKSEEALRATIVQMTAEAEQARKRLEGENAEQRKELVERIEALSENAEDRKKLEAQLADIEARHKEELKRREEQDAEQNDRFQKLVDERQRNRVALEAAEKKAQAVVAKAEVTFAFAPLCPVTTALACAGTLPHTPTTPPFFPRFVAAGRSAARARS